jgi:Fe-S cluster assembly iron-binding protein IscA
VHVIEITPLAAARLTLLISQEPDADRLGIRLVQTTSGCGSQTFGIAITEPEPGDRTACCNGIRVFYREADAERISGLVIDCDARTGRFSLFHPRPLPNRCPLPSQ